MADRSTSAVDVAQDSGGEPLTAKAEEATADEVTEPLEGVPAHDGAQEDDGVQDPVTAASPELHSGHKLAGRYRLEECVTRLDGFSSWRAMDEKLRRAVGVHLLPADHPRARSVLAAARSAALLGDPRFVQVLDAVEENDLVYVVHEWLPDATELTALLAAGPLEAHDAYQLVSQISQAMAAAHREGLAHLRLTPGAVLRSSSGQYRIRGLAVNAALRGIASDSPARTDTEAVGALLYAALTQRWPYEEDAYGLTGLPKDVGLIAPDQVRAGIHRGLSELAMRALVNEGATASRQEPPCVTPDDLVKAVGEMPRVRPPEPTYTAPPDYQRTTYQQGAYARPPAVPGASPAPPPSPPAPLQTPTGKILKWGVSALLIVALGLGSWQLAEALMAGDNKNDDPSNSESSDKNSTGEKDAPAPKALKISGAQEYYPDGTPQHAGDVGKTYDGDSSTYWRTKSFTDGPDMNPAFKDGVGIVYDLGTKHPVSGASIGFRYGGDHTTVSLYAADSMSSSAPLSSMKKFATDTTSGTSAKIKAKSAVKSRYVLVWMTAMPSSGEDEFSGAGYKQAITDVKFQG
ncbi:protein kinase family protein [Streptomyces tsukubensis]|uniref:Serine/threonine protein kinase n=1 Tax=Streptomyces tsukubensis TaxID=83656 RepID=A0A1V4A9M2_9ACTN|nr:protein kinase family protein [Streptomyces tsukubensis]OON79263.1 serine/threonine protein kinase [Streptomyces tsukubensis]QFR94617.1 serine/threonine protein kinase [Streptomyces tsukubensis]